MECPCCRVELVRAADLPEIRGWMRYGDRYCDDCTWVFPRELLDDEGEFGETCPCHGAIQPAKPTSS